MIDLDEFVQGYAECALFCSSVEEDYAAENEDVSADSSMIDAGFSFGDIDPDALAAMRADCDRFIEANYADVKAYIDAVGDWTGPTDSLGHSHYSGTECAGHDFWYDRNGHGVGYRDRVYEHPLLTENVAKRLSDAASTFGETYLYALADGKVYA